MKTVKSLPQTLLYKYLRLKRIKVNGKRAQGDYRLSEGDTVELYISDEFFGGGQPNAAFLRVTPNINVIYEDQNILLVDKKPGMLVHPDDTESFNTLIAHIQAYLYRKGEYDPDKEQSFAPALCNRIDRNTGGIVIAAKNAETLRIINEKIKSREIHKYYLCLVHGILKQKSGLLQGYLEKDSEKNRVYISDKPFKEAQSIATRYTVIAEKNKMSLLEVELITGRTHQIRAHFAHIGHPLVGDGKYGTNELNKGLGRKYQALYSYRISFDFKTGAGILNYLNRRDFRVDSVDFAEAFLS